MFNTPELLTWILGQAVVAAAIWGGIRADIKGIHAKMELAISLARETSARLDRHIELFGNHTNGRS